MDRVWHFWNLQGISVTWKVKCEGPAVCRGALYESLVIPWRGGFVISRKALPNYRHLWSMYRSWDINTWRTQVLSGAGTFGILIYSRVISSFTFSFSPSSVWADPVFQVLFCQVGQAEKGEFLANMHVPLFILLTVDKGYGVCLPTIPDLLLKDNSFLGPLKETACVKWKKWWTWLSQHSIVILRNTFSDRRVVVVS